MTLYVDLNSLFVTVAGAVMAHYLIKWLDRNK